jgi:hypothetical protein
MRTILGFWLYLAILATIARVPAAANNATAARMRKIADCT